MARSALVITLLSVAAMATALFLFPFDSDGALAVNDGVWYGEVAERDPPKAILGQHALFHVIAAAIIPVLSAAAIDHPGHVATRLVAGLGGAWLLLQIAAAAGRSRAALGGLFALVLLCTRGFLVEAAGGETVLPGAAAALAALVIAGRPATSLAWKGAALSVAIWMRMDNVMIVPGVALALWPTLERGARVRVASGFLIATACATMAGYIAIWLVAARGATTLAEWLFPYQGPYQDLGALSAAVYLSGIVSAFAGQTWAREATCALQGVTIIAAIAAAGLLLRGSRPRVPRLAPAVATLLAYGAFHAWFEANNFEWVVFPVALVLATGAALVPGDPVTPPAARVAGTALLAVLAAGALVLHAAHTLALRDRRLMDLVAEVTAPPRDGWRIVTPDARVAGALYLRGGAYAHDPAWTFSPDATEPTVVIFDRLAGDGMPYTTRTLRFAPRPHDVARDGPGVTCVFRDGVVCAILLDPRSIPASRESR